MTSIFTSISPSHANSESQGFAVASWIAHGFTPVSFNAPKEINALADEYPGVRFVECHRNGQRLYKAPYTLINSFIDHAKETGLAQAFIVNSDIAISDPQGLINDYLSESRYGLVFSNRHDHNGDGQNPTRYEFGFDAFMINREHFDLLPQSLFAMGQTWWDYWIPYRFIKEGVPIELVKEPIFLHHRHPVQYHQKEWERMTEHFVWIERYGKQPYISNGRNAQNITNEVYSLIKRHAR